MDHEFSILTTTGGMTDTSFSGHGAATEHLDEADGVMTTDSLNNHLTEIKEVDLDNNPVGNVATIEVEFDEFRKEDDFDLADGAIPSTSTTAMSLSTSFMSDGGSAGDAAYSNEFQSALDILDQAIVEYSDPLPSSDEALNTHTSEGEALLVTLDDDLNDLSLKTGHSSMDPWSRESMSSGDILEDGREKDFMFEDHSPVTNGSGAGNGGPKKLENVSVPMSMYVADSDEDVHEDDKVATQGTDSKQLLSHLVESQAFGNTAVNIYENDSDEDENVEIFNVAKDDINDVPASDELASKTKTLDGEKTVPEDCLQMSMSNTDQSLTDQNDPHQQSYFGVGNTAGNASDDDETVEVFGKDGCEAGVMPVASEVVSEIVPQFEESLSSVKAISMGTCSEAQTNTDTILSDPEPFITSFEDPPKAFDNRNIPMTTEEVGTDEGPPNEVVDIVRQAPKVTGGMFYDDDDDDDDDEPEIQEQSEEITLSSNTVTQTYQIVNSTPQQLSEARMYDSDDDEREVFREPQDNLKASFKAQESYEDIQFDKQKSVADNEGDVVSSELSKLNFETPKLPEDKDLQDEELLDLLPGEVGLLQSQEKTDLPLNIELKEDISEVQEDMEEKFLNLLPSGDIEVTETEAKNTTDLWNEVTLVTRSAIEITGLESQGEAPEETPADSSAAFADDSDFNTFQLLRDAGSTKNEIDAKDLNDDEDDEQIELFSEALPKSEEIESNICLTDSADYTYYSEQNFTDMKNIMPADMTSAEREVKLQETVLSDASAVEGDQGIVDTHIVEKEFSDIGVTSSLEKVGDSEEKSLKLTLSEVELDFAKSMNFEENVNSGLEAVDHQIAAEAENIDDTEASAVTIGFDDDFIVIDKAPVTIKEELVENDPMSLLEPTDVDDQRQEFIDDLEIELNLSGDFNSQEMINLIKGPDETEVNLNDDATKTPLGELLVQAKKENTEDFGPLEVPSIQQGISDLNSSFEAEKLEFIDAGGPEISASAEDVVILPDNQGTGASSTDGQENEEADKNSQHDSSVYHTPQEDEFDFEEFDRSPRSSSILQISKSESSNTQQTSSGVVISVHDLMQEQSKSSVKEDIETAHATVSVQNGGQVNDLQSSLTEWDNVQTIVPEILEDDAPKPKSRGHTDDKTSSKSVDFPEAWEHFKNSDMSQYQSLIKPVIERRGLAAIRRFLFGPPKLHPDLIAERDRTFCLAACPLDNGNSMHIKVLQTIYKKITGSKFDCPRVGGHWEIIGFQGNDPATDLRGTGFLALLHLLFFLTDSKLYSEALDIYKLSLHQTQNFPFCLMSINVTRIALQVLRQDGLNRDCNRQKAVMLPVAEFYVGLFSQFAHIWKSQNKTIMDSGFVIKDLENWAKKNPKAVTKSFQTAQLSKSKRAASKLAVEDEPLVFVDLCKD